MMITFDQRSAQETPFVQGLILTLRDRLNYQAQIPNHLRFWSDFLNL